MHKYIKRILFFLSILLLQFSYENKLAGSASCDGFNFDGEFSEQLNLDFSETSFKENHIFETSFLEIVSCRSVSFCDGYAELVESWKAFKNAGLDDLARNTDQLAKFDALAKSNNLVLDAKGLEDLLKLPSTKIDAATGLPLKWDNPDKVLDAVQRASDANVNGLTVTHKKFPAPADGSDSYTLRNAKIYQAEASGDAGLEFRIGNAGWDDIDDAGILIDRKWGHGSTIFEKVDDGLGNISYNVKPGKDYRVDDIMKTAKRQVDNAGGNPIRWEVETEIGAEAIQDLFLKSQDPAIRKIKVKHVAQIAPKN